MSFILDALKKSESDRQRQSGPALFEVRVAPPRTRLPTWAIAIALLLVLNLGVVLWMLLRHQGHAPAPLASDTLPPAAAAGAAPTAPSPAVPATSAPMAAGSAPPVPVVAVSSAGTGAAPPPSTGAPSAPPAASASTTPSAPSATPGAEPGSPEDYAPAEDRSAPAPGSHVRRGTDSGIPLYQDLTSTPGTQLPQLRLDLHVFAAHPQERFVMVNMHKLREGDTLP
ncbi:MAG: general secretion pathway protein GspB, partial [Steroidobacteraceae bacterium]